MSDKENISDISVIIPTADREQLLCRAVDSVLKQSVLPSKIVVVDNGVDEVKVQFDDPRVVIIRTLPRLGCGKPRNIGAQNCDSKLIAFLDDDDWWDSGYIENTIKKFEDTNADVVVGQLKRYGIDDCLRNHKLFPESPDLQRKVFFSNPGFGGQNIAIKKEVFMEVGGFDECMPASVDRDLAARLIVSGKYIVCEPKAIAIVCDHGGVRVRMNIVKGNWMFICKHWRKMRLNELFWALRILLKRVYVVKRFGTDRLL
ncbi:MAG: glycosyltransferase family 2 protein [Candidatus Dadabacteria bacterium]|nr:glycosyltransferase family 2 protein [Candidatus Dadabacteria bacterium]